MNEGPENTLNSTRKIIAAPQSPPSFEAVFNHLKDAVGVAKHGIHEFCNPAYATLFGYDDPEALIGKSIFDLIADDERERVRTYAMRRLAGESAPTLYETRGLRKDGTVFDMEVQPSTYRLEGEGHTLVILRDISERKRIERELRYSEELNRRVLQAVPGGVVLVAQNGSILHANEEAQRILGLTQDKISRLYVADFDTETIAEDGSHFPAKDYPVSKCLATGEQQAPVTMGVRKPNGQISWAIFTAVPTHDPVSAKQTGAVVTFLDITARKKDEEQRRESDERYRSALTAIHEAVMVFDRNAVILACNPSCEHMFGVKPEIMIGHSIATEAWKAVREDGSPFPTAEYPAIVSAREGRALSNIVMGLYKPTGDLMWISMNSEPIFRPGSPEPYGAVVSITDITERKRSEEALRRSEKRLEAIVSNTPNVAVEGYDIDGRVLYWNKAAEKIFGYRADEAIGKTLDQLILDPQATGAFVEMLKSIDRDCKAHSPVEWNFKARNGREGWLYSTAFPIRAENGRKEFICMDVDISQLKTAERDLAHSLSLVQATLESTADGILAVSKDHVIKSWNRKFVEMWGIDLKILETRDDARLRSSVMPQIANPDEYVQNVKELHADPTRAGFFTIYLKDGRVIERYTYPQFLHGEIIGRVLSFRDVTARVSAEKERLALERKLLDAQKLESLGVLAGGIAHDFNNLLAAVLGNVSLAAMQIPPHSPARPFLTSIETTTHRAAELCKQMLAYSGKGRFVVQPVDINALIREMAELLRISIGNNISLSFNLAPEVQPVAADATQIRQVVMNMILNAAEAIGAAKPGVISLRSGVCQMSQAALAEAFLAPELPAGEYMYVEVADSGCGMDAATVARIFDPFFTTKFTGRGLGLAAVLGIVRGHRGAIKVDSEPGNGTTFRVLLPHEKSAVAATPRPPAPKLSGRLLLVEDDETLRVLQVRMIESIGMSALSAGNGPEALELFRSDPTGFAAALMDLSMPGMSGEELCAELFALRPDLPILLMSGFENADVIQRCSQKGSVRFLQKPFMPADLAREISLLLKLSQ
jgi:two-component system cell cycle sensor histidine kinase/response regulator CckA